MVDQVMLNERLGIRCSGQQLREWRRTASTEGRTLGDWVRAALDAEAFSALAARQALERDIRTTAISQEVQQALDAAMRDLGLKGEEIDGGTGDQNQDRCGG